MSSHAVMKKHIKARLSKGHDIFDIKDHLSKKGIEEEKIHTAIDHAYKEIANEKRVRKDLSFFLHPSKSKFILPLLILLIFLIHIFTSMTIIPELSKDLCENVDMMNELQRKVIRKASIEEVTEQEKLIIEKDVSIINNFKQYTVANLPLIMTKLHWIDPLYPTPCEARSLFKEYNCRYYISAVDYNCLKHEVRKTKLGVLFDGETPDYHQVSYFGLAIHTFFLVFFAYIINSLIVFYYNKNRHRFSLRTIELFEFGFVLFFVLLILLGVYLYIKIMTGVA